MGKYFTMAIDGSGVYTFDEEPYAGLPVKNKQKRQNDLESKCVGSQTCFSNGAFVYLFQRSG